jgi:Nuclease A inhibitor-like protein
MQFFFHENDKDLALLIGALRMTCEALVYVSEMDSPVVPFVGALTSDLTPEVVVGQIGKGNQSHVEVRSFDELFERLTCSREWFGNEESERAQKFLELKCLLEENLTNLQVYRLGTTRVDIYVVGLYKDQRIVGVSMAAVET